MAVNLPPMLSTREGKLLAVEVRLASDDAVRHARGVGVTMGSTRKFLRACWSPVSCCLIGVRRGSTRAPAGDRQRTTRRALLERLCVWVSEVGSIDAWVVLS